MLAGMDISGDPEPGNHKSMAIVIGTGERRALTRHLGHEPVHTGRISGRDAKNAVINGGRIRRKECHGPLHTAGKKRTFSRIRARPRQRHRFDSNKKVTIPVFEAVTAGRPRPPRRPDVPKRRAATMALRRGPHCGAFAARVFGYGEKGEVSGTLLGGPRRRCRGGPACAGALAAAAPPLPPVWMAAAAR